MLNSIIDRWVKEAMSLNPGEELFIPCHSKIERTKTLRQFSRILVEYMKIDAVTASKLLAVPIFQDGKHWAKITMRSQSPLVGFKKVNGELVKVTLSDDSDRIRRIKMMITDGLNREEVDKVLEPSLTEDEIKVYFVNN